MLREWSASFETQNGRQLMNGSLIITTDTYLDFFDTACSFNEKTLATRFLSEHVRTPTNRG